MTPEIRNKLWRICKNTLIQSEFVLVPENEPKFLDWDRIFPRKFDKYYLELGSGWGEVVLELAKQNPDTGFLAVERKWNRLAQIEMEIRNRNLSNLILTGINFQWFLEDLILPQFIDTILLNFPDPWPKKKHHKNRAIQDSFIPILANILKPGGKFLFATDHFGYFRHALRVFRRSRGFLYDKEWSLDRPGFPVSVFEKEKREEGKKIYYLERIKA